MVIRTLWDSVLFWRRVAVVLATLSLALFVAVIIARDPPDFSTMPIVAVVRDGEQRPVWEIRLARAAHQSCRQHTAATGSRRPRLSTLASGSRVRRAAPARPFTAIWTQANCGVTGECPPVDWRRRIHCHDRAIRRLAWFSTQWSDGFSGHSRRFELSQATHNRPRHLRAERHCAWSSWGKAWRSCGSALVARRSRLIGASRVPGIPPSRDGSLGISSKPTGCALTKMSR